MWQYTEKVYEYFKNPKNVGEIENPDAVGEIGSIVCGDALKLTLRIDKATEKIVDAKFKTFGCGSAIASSSLATEMLKGKTIDQALEIKNTEIVNELALPPVKIHCSVLAEDAIKAAINDYKAKNGAPAPAAAKA